MQTRLPARLPAPELLSLAHVTSLEQSRAEREQRRKRGRPRMATGGLEPGVGSDVEGVEWEVDLAF